MDSFKEKQEVKLEELRQRIVLVALTWRDQEPTGFSSREDRDLIKILDDYEYTYFQKESKDEEG